MKIGFTGTRNGMTGKQMAMALRVFSDCYNKSGVQEFHHGDCIGADEEMHFAVDLYDGAIRNGLKIAIHPGHSHLGPKDVTHRAFCKGDIAYDSKSYFERNRDIVNATDLLIATPRTKLFSTRGGTVYTINYAKDQGKPYIIIFPDGSVDAGEKE